MRVNFMFVHVDTVKSNFEITEVIKDQTAFNSDLITEAPANIRCTCWWTKGWYLQPTGRFYSSNWR